jgi:quercetin dioxygenase-like cupin family protein
MPGWRASEEGQVDVHPAKGVTSAFGGGHFTGRVWLDLLLERSGEDGMRMYRVIFEPGSRTHWHTHPGGQALMIVAGTARAGAEGEPTVVAGQGDVIHTPPGQWHWHGAGPDGSMVHVAFNPGPKTEWGDDREVSAEEYEPPAG